MKIQSTLIAALLGTVVFTARAADPSEPRRPVAPTPATPPEPDEEDQLLDELMATRAGRPAGQRGRTRERGGPPRKAAPGAAAAGPERGARRCGAPIARRRMHP